ncbi:MAG: hypothetical protein ACJ8FK_13615, partial [Xanthobacteraceae bacterium]
TKIKAAAAREKYAVFVTTSARTGLLTIASQIVPIDGPVYMGVARRLRYTNNYIFISYLHF